MDVTLLRKMTRKSIMTFGQYCDNNVNELLIFHRFNYLRWVYFNCSMITFMDDILDEINIPESFRIQKPGKCPEKHNELTEILKSKMSGLSKYRLNKKVERNRKIKADIKESNGSYSFTKANLTAKNHGKL